MQEEVINNNEHHGLVTHGELLDWQSASIDRIAQLNVNYLGATVTILVVLVGFFQYLAYRVSSKQIRDLEKKIDLRTAERVSKIESKLTNDILGGPRVDKLVEIAGTIYLVTQNGLIGFSSNQALRDWQYNASDAILPNPQELGLKQIGTIDNRNSLYNHPLDQIIAEAQQLNSSTS